MKMEIEGLCWILNIPAEAVDVFGTGLKNTHEEACALTHWAAKAGIAPIHYTNRGFSSRRVRWVFSRSLATVGAEVMIDLLQIPRYSIRRLVVAQRRP